MYDKINMEIVDCYQCLSPNAKLLLKDSETHCTVVKCNVCGAYYTRKRLREDDINHLYEKDECYAERCVSSWSEEWLPSHYNELQEIEKLMSMKGRLLDIGCGGGAFVYASRKKGWESYGIDLSETGINRGRQFWNLGENIIMCKNVYSMNSDKPFDVITTFHVFEHLYQPSKFINKIHDLLSDEGMLVVAVPNFGSIDVQKDPLIKKSFMHLPYHVTHFTPNSLSMLLRNNGLEVIRRKFYPSEWIIKLIKPFVYPFKKREIKSKEYSGENDYPRITKFINKNISSKKKILNILSKISPGSYMVFYAKKSH